MKILLASIGTRGDMEPFLALGEKLRQWGHEVMYLFPAQYCSLVPKVCISYAMSKKFVQLVESEDGKVLMGGKIGFFKKIRSYYRLYKIGMKINHEMYQEQYDCIESVQPDIILHHPKCLYPIVWRLKYSKKSILISPVPYIIHKVDDKPNLGFGKSSYQWWNRFTYTLGNYGIVKTLYDEQTSVPENQQYTKGELKSALLNGQMIYTISPSLFQRDIQWHKGVQVLGYYERNKMLEWTPEKGLIQFLQDHKKVVILTFGSMVNPDPESNSAMIYKVFDDLKIPVVVNLAAGGLVKLDNYSQNERFYFVNQIPYDWILDKVYGIVHHGGSGTTHSAAKYGCVSLILPHIIDQYVWNDIISSKGIGPKGIALKNITFEKLKTLLYDMYENPLYKQNVTTLSKRMRAEDFENELRDFITETT
ncbi:MAG: glycosyltransferase family 1 protein [Saprospiraceae bacterium]|nr:glycosyltransferase family 1 protein [Saprospiraceae bacterium]